MFVSELIEKFGFKHLSGSHLDKKIENISYDFVELGYGKRENMIRLGSQFKHITIYWQFFFIGFCMYYYSRGYCGGTGHYR